MKKSYELIGVFWDHKPIQDSQIEYSDHKMEALGYRSEPSLFDLFKKRRYIKLSTLLDIESEDQIAELKFLLEDCDELEILVDYQPVVKNAVHDKYYEHRVSQCTTLLKNMLPHTSLYFVKRKGDVNDAIFK